MAGPSRVSTCPRMMAGPTSPGVARFWYQPAGAPGCNGGTAMVPSLLSPSGISDVLIPIAGMASCVGTDRGKAAGPAAVITGGGGLPGEPASTAAANGPGGPCSAIRLVADELVGTAAGRPPTATSTTPATASTAVS